jgi:ubiquinone/menaquinone biosynthesis C-methylase UbiE
VKKAAAFNRKMVRVGRCTVRQGNVSRLDFNKESYDLATAFETIYFWPGLEQCFGEVAGILKQGGRFLIVNEDDGLTGNNEKWEKMIEGMLTYKPDELRAHLTNAGFRDIAVHGDEQHHWLTVIATK